MTSIRTTSRLAWLIPAFMVVGCSHTIPETTNRPQPPAQLGKTAPASPPATASIKQAEAPESMLPVTLTADLTPVQRSIRSALPERLSDENHPLSGDYHWRFHREGEPDVTIQNGLVKYKAMYRGEIESSAARACRLDPLYPVIEGTGRLLLREQDEGLLVTITDHQTQITLTEQSDTKCNMFNVPVKEQLAELFQQHELNQLVVRSVEQAGYSIPLNLVWERLQQPMPVRSGDTQLCLYGQVREFIIGSMKGSAQQTEISGVARQAPVALYHTPCQKGSGGGPMKVHMDNTVAAAQEGQPYKVLLTVPVPYAVLNQQLQERLYQQTVKVPTTFGDKLVIEKVTASDVNGRTLLTIDTSGDLNGTLYYWGTPRLEGNGNTIGMSDLQMANETQMALGEVKSGYAQMVDKELRERLRQAVSIDLSQRLANMKNALSGQHKSGGLAMDLLLTRQEASQVTSKKDGLHADILLEGTATAEGRLPVKQPVQRDAIEKDRPMSEKPRAARAQDDQR